MVLSTLRSASLSRISNLSQPDFCAATARCDGRRVKDLYTGKKSALSPANSVPHDLGDPEDEPIVKVNAYRYRKGIFY